MPLLLGTYQSRVLVNEYLRRRAVEMFDAGTCARDIASALSIPRNHVGTLLHKSGRDVSQNPSPRGPRLPRKHRLAVPPPRVAITRPLIEERIATMCHLRYVEGWTLKRIAELMGVTREWVRVLTERHRSDVVIPADVGAGEWVRLATVAEEHGIPAATIFTRLRKRPEIERRHMQNGAVFVSRTDLPTLLAEYRPPVTPLMEHCRKHIRIMADSGCWLWTGPLDARGYPIAGQPKNHPAPTRLVRVLLWLEAGGPAPGKCRILADCEVRACVNPSHRHMTIKGERFTVSEGQAAALWQRIEEKEGEAA